eukprot:TRINITY_DN23491_c0_g1_i1.p1 TRINITY_DN23491_c0_g1~~TRINITY_DN23491_c0_g1_i1.p1  ORF type:complete len:396 (-),score=70.70 TRINITY_DN23491_c0_g1_i1:105-1292(-)
MFLSGITLFLSTVVTFCRSQAPLAAVLRQAVDPAEVEHVRQAARLAREESGEYVQRRKFGTGNYTVGHTVVYLHDHLEVASPGLRQRMQQLAFRLGDVAGWNVSGGRPLKVRCLELISYESTGEDENIGWHTDGATLMTIAIMMSDRSDYQGGALSLRSDNGEHTENHELQFGDAAAWRGWTDHQVAPVASGRRDVFVSEWWLGKDCNETGIPRLSDSPQALKESSAIDPTSSHLHRLLGRSLCKHAPCESAEVEEEAEAAYRKAAELAPRQHKAHEALGVFFLGQSSSWMAGQAHIQRSCELNPYKSFVQRQSCFCWSFLTAVVETARQQRVLSSFSGSVEEPGDLSLTLPGQVKQAFGLLALLLFLGPAVLWLEKQDKKKTKNPSAGKSQKTS